MGTVLSGTILRGYSTGFLVSNCHVLTVRHAVRADKAKGQRVDFQARTPTRSFTSKGIVVAEGGFSERFRSIEKGQARYKDWALIRLNDCLGRELGFLTLSMDRPRMTTELQLVGFPGDRSRSRQTIDPNCRIRATLGRQFLHDCATDRGSSGSPIFDARTNEVVAMHSAGVRFSGVRSFSLEEASIAIPSSELRQAVSKTTERASPQSTLIGSKESKAPAAPAALAVMPARAARSGPKMGKNSD